jgi:hypothetical protein
MPAPRGEVIFQSENRNGMDLEGNNIDAKDAGRMAQPRLTVVAHKGECRSWQVEGT